MTCEMCGEYIGDDYYLLHELIICTRCLHECYSLSFCLDAPKKSQSTCTDAKNKIPYENN